MKERVYCLNHPNKLARNAKRLCDTCTKERHEKSAQSKGLTIKKKENECSERSLETRMPIRPIKSKKTKIKPYSEKTKKIKKEEYAVFREIFIERPPYCEWCETPITEFHIRNYHHLKTKGAHPELRLDKNNIVKICFICHDKEHGFKPRK